MINNTKIRLFLLTLFSIIFTCNIFLTNSYAADNYVARDALCPMTDPAINRMESEHFQIVWGNADTSGTITKEFVQGNLENLENIRAFYVNELKMQDTSLSAWGDKTTHYKTNLYISDTGLPNITNNWAYMTTDPEGYAYIVTMPGAMRVDEPSWVLPHEYAHAIVYHQGGAIQHAWAEPWANWFRDQFLGSKYYKHGNKVYGPTSDFFSPMLLKSDYYFPHMLNYYDAWPILLYVSENPDNLQGLGMDTIRKVLTDKTNNENILDRIARISGISIKDLLGYYSRRMVTMDFSRQEHYLKQFDKILAEGNNKDVIYTTLKSENDWLVVPNDKAPMQQGFNVVPLDVNFSSSGSISVNFENTSNDAAADFRVNIVTKTADNKTRYSSMWDKGKNSIALKGDETAAYLVVCATPNNMKQLETFDENAVSTRFTYRIQVTTSAETIKDDNTTNAELNNNADANNNVADKNDNSNSNDNNNLNNNDNIANNTENNSNNVNNNTNNNSNNANTNNSTQNNENASNNEFIPNTGDSTYIYTALIILVVSTLFIVKIKKKRNYTTY